MTSEASRITGSVLSALGQERAPFRRDTHDGAIPEAVFALLAFSLSLRAPSPEQALSMPADTPVCEAARHWIAGDDPRCIETASALVRRWTEPHEDAHGE